MKNKKRKHIDRYVRESGKYISAKAHCKYCRCEITLEVHEDYLHAGDKYKLFPMAACNKCADYRVARRGIFDSIRLVSQLLQTDQVPESEMEKSRENIKRLAQGWMRLFSDHHSLPMPDWDEAIVQSVMAEPENYWQAFTNIPKMFGPRQLV